MEKQVIGESKVVKVQEGSLKKLHKVVSECNETEALLNEKIIKDRDNQYKEWQELLSQTREEG